VKKLANICIVSFRGGNLLKKKEIVSTQALTHNKKTLSSIYGAAYRRDE
jgi:hypothetical protein